MRLDDWPDADRGSRIVVICRDLEEAYLRSTLEALRLPAGSGRPASLAEVVGAAGRVTDSAREDTR